MLKAIGASNFVVGVAAIIQIIAVTVFGVALGAAVTLLLSLGFPPTIPIFFAPSAVAASVGGAAPDWAHRWTGFGALFGEG